MGRWPAITALAAFLGGLLLYLSTLAPSLAYGDPAEYIFVPHAWGILHPPGYAFMTLLVKAWQTLVPVGSLAYRTNLLAAAAGAGTVALVTLTVSRVTCHASRLTPHVTRHPGHPKGRVTLPALFAALSLLAAPDFWQHSLHANAHIVTALLAALALFLLAQWKTAGDDRWLYGFAFTAGLSVTHHPLLVMSFPAYAAFILFSRPGILRDWRTLAKLGGFALLGLLPWLYFPMRSAFLPAPPLGQPYDMNTLRGFLNLALARGLVVNIFPFSLSEQPHRLIVFWTLLRLQFSLPVIALAVLGLGWLWRRVPRLGLLFAFHLLLNLGFILNTVQDVMAYLLVPFTAIALLSGVGALALTQYVIPSTQYASHFTYRVPRQSRSVLTLAALGALLLWPAVRLARQLPHISMRRERSADQWVESVFDKWEGSGEHAFLLADWEHMTPLWYYRFVEGKFSGPEDVTPIHVAGTSPSPWVDTVWAYIEDGPIYLIEYRRDIADAGFRLRAEGEFYRVLPPSEAHIAPQIPDTMAARARPLEFLGYELEEGPYSPGATVSLVLYLRTAQTVSDILQPIASLGPWTFAYTTDSHLLTPSWQPGEVVGERWDFTLPLDAPAGEYHLALAIVNLTTGETLEWENSETALPLGTLTIQGESRTPPEVAAGLRANFGQREGLAAAWAKSDRSGWQNVPWATPLEVQAGENLEIRLRWRALAPDETSQTVFLHLLDANNMLWASRDYTPLGGAFPTLLWFPRWLPEQEVTDPYQLTVPADAPPGEYYLETGLYVLRSVQRTPIYDVAGNMAGDRFVLGGVLVVP